MLDLGERIETRSNNNITVSTGGPVHNIRTPSRIMTYLSFPLMNNIPLFSSCSLRWYASRIPARIASCSLKLDNTQEICVWETYSSQVHSTVRRDVGNSFAVTMIQYSFLLVLSLIQATVGEGIVYLVFNYWPYCAKVIHWGIVGLLGIDVSSY